MTEYLSYIFEDTPALADTFDELPLWSAPFGLLLLKHLTLNWSGKSGELILTVPMAYIEGEKI